MSHVEDTRLKFLDFADLNPVILEEEVWIYIESGG